MTPARRRRITTTSWLDLVAVILTRMPPLPDAACIGRPELFDGSSAADRDRAIEICLSDCPALQRCAQWLATLSSEPRPPGVTAGRYRGHLRFCDRCRAPLRERGNSARFCSVNCRHAARRNQRKATERTTQ